MGYLGNNSVLRTEIALRGWNLRDLKIPPRFGHYFSIAHRFLKVYFVRAFIKLKGVREDGGGSP